MPLSTFLSNADVKKTALSFLKGGRLPHAFLILGEKGLGKRTFAKCFAAEIILHFDPSRDPLVLQRQIDQNAYPDVSAFGPDEGARSFRIQTVRGMLASLYTKPNQSEKKVYLVTQCHLMTEEAQNALLKALEEPPLDTVFLLTADDASSLLPTILSRVCILRLNPVEESDCARVLADRFPDAETQELQTAVFLADGNIGKALRYMTGESDKTAFSIALKVIHGIIERRESDILIALSAAEKQRDLLLLCMENIARLTSALLLIKKKVCVMPDAPARLGELSGRLTTRQLTQIFTCTCTVVDYAEKNVGGSLLGAAACSLFASVIA